MRTGGRSLLIGTPQQLLSVVVILAFAAFLAPDAARAQDVERSGKDVVDAVCIACHGTGAHGAPRIGDQRAWSKLASRGLTGLTQSALKGIRQMPPHGANMTLTDTEMRDAIIYMINKDRVPETTENTPR